MGGFLKKYGWMYIPGVVFLLLSTYLQIQVPRLLGQIVDALRLPAIDRRQIYTLVLTMLGVVLLTFVSRYTWRQFIHGNARHLEAHLRQTLFTHFQKMGVFFYSGRKTGDLMAYAVNDINAIRMTFGPAVSMLINGIVMTAMAVAGMSAGVDGRLTVFALAPVPFIVVILVFMGREVRARFKRVQETFASVSDRVQENISGLRVIKAYVQEDAEVERFEKLNRRSRDVNLAMVKVSASMTPVVELLFGVSFTVGLIYGSGLVRGGSITLGDFVAFNGYLAMIVQPVRSVSRIINVFSRGAASFKRYRALLETPVTIRDGEGAPGPVDHADIEIKNLNFSYPEDPRYALRNIDLRVRPGGSLGILGRTGSGKTTLVNLLAKLYNVPDGKIFIGGADLNSFTLDQLRAPIGYVPQDNFLFSASIEENIRFFNAGFERAQVEEAAEKACILDNITEFPDGFDTQVGERGMSVSGGQKQRICIARALIIKPDLLILDDSLSAVDVQTEAAIIKNLKEQTERGGSLIVIAHRVSALAGCDEIIVLENGEITERGTHGELIAADGFYAAIAREQSEADDSNEGEEDAP